MPVIRCSNGKWRIGSGKCIYTSKEKAERAYKGYLASEHSGIKKDVHEAIARNEGREKK